VGSKAMCRSKRQESTCPWRLVDSIDMSPEYVDP
jgi:hypothetical protein